MDFVSLFVSIKIYKLREWGSRIVISSFVGHKLFSFRVVVLVDMSLAMAGDMMRIHGDIRQLLEQQLPSTDLYNIIW